jgi:hypothetical protein
MSSYDIDFTRDGGVGGTGGLLFGLNAMNGLSQPAAAVGRRGGWAVRTAGLSDPRWATMSRAGLWRTPTSTPTSSKSGVSRALAGVHEMR